MILCNFFFLYIYINFTNSVTNAFDSESFFERRPIICFILHFRNGRSTEWTMRFSTVTDALLCRHCLPRSVYSDYSSESLAGLGYDTTRGRIFRRRDFFGNGFGVTALRSPGGRCFTAPVITVVLLFRYRARTVRHDRRLSVVFNYEIDIFSLFQHRFSTTTRSKFHWFFFVFFFKTNTILNRPRVFGLRITITIRKVESAQRLFVVVATVNLIFHGC